MSGSKPVTIGFFVFYHVEELDLVGPWQVLTTAGLETGGALQCWTVAQTQGALVCSKGLRLVPDYDFQNHPAMDILLVPGGRGIDALLKDDIIHDWLHSVAPSCQLITSVCSGSLLLVASGLATGKMITTHQGRYQQIIDLALPCSLKKNARFWQDGNIITSAGISAGIDMAFYLTKILFSTDIAQKVARRMEYSISDDF
jgi:transcriptional regulator GlxA family with amidase domain